MYYISIVFDAIGILLVSWGGLVAAVSFVWSQLVKVDKQTRQKLEINYRQNFASKLILGLEFFLAVDIIKTVISPTWDSIGMLGAIVVIRTLLTYFLNKEIKDVK